MMPAGWKPSAIPPQDTIIHRYVYKGEEALHTYGKKGANGVVQITLQNFGLIYFDLIKVGSSDSIHIQDNALIIVNGKDIVNGNDLTPGIWNILMLDPSRINQMSAHKNDEVARQYGDKGKNGVIVITLKKEVGKDWWVI